MKPNSFSQWNSALINALFLRPDKSSSTLSRLDATGRVLEELSGGQDRLSAKRSFIKAFGTDPGAIRKNFMQSPAIALLTNRDGIPPNFAALYLTLLAASADDNTFHVGGFRKRFAALLGIEELDNFHFNDLPALWKQFALWTQTRAASVGDCAVLVLPDPLHENLIGHSKRLAFPSYRDELNLRNALEEDSIDSSDPFHAVSRSAYERLGKFSQTFKEELSGFQSLVYSLRLQEAYDSPFWGAVRDITREEKKKELAQFGSLCVQLDTVDPLFPELTILFDERACNGFLNGQALRLPRARGPYVAGWAGSNLRDSISALMSMTGKDKKFARSRLGVSLKAGCLPFFLDEFGGFSSDGRYLENGPCCLMIRAADVPPIKSLARHVGLQFDEMGTNETLGQWTILLFSVVSKLFIERLAMVVPSGARKLFATGWAPSRPRIAGAARYGQAVLLTPASNPFVRLDGASSGQYAILDGSGTELLAGDLCVSEDGFYIPPTDLVGVEGKTLCRFVLHTEVSGTVNILEVPVVDAVPSAPLMPAEGRYEWLVDGRLGMRESIAASFLSKGADRQTRVNSLPHVGGSHPLFTPSSAKRHECLLESIDSICNALDWLSEAISLRFQTRRVLQFYDLKAHLRMAAEASGIDSWRLRRALFAGGWLQTIESPLTPHGAIVAGMRTISSMRQGGRIILRICGMLTKQERLELTNELLNGEVCRRITDPSVPLSIGCIELDVFSDSRVDEIASMLRLRKIPRKESALDVFGGLILSRTLATESAAPTQSSAVELWDTRKHQWVPEIVTREQLPLGSILRAQGRQRYTYYVKVGQMYRCTDSRNWAMLMQAACNVEALGVISKFGDVEWTGSLHGLPNALCRWWMHFGGGVVGINKNGNFTFRGGNSLQLWDSITNRGLNRQLQQDSPAVKRRALAASLLKKRRAK